MIEISLDHDAVQAGAFLDGHVAWRSDKHVERVIASAEWRTQGKGDPAWGVGRSLVVTPAPGTHGGEFRFHLMIPHGGPVTYDGTLMSIEWLLAVRLDQRGFDETASRTFRVESHRPGRQRPFSPSSSP